MHFIAFLILSIFPTGASHARPEPESADITQRDDRCLITLSDGFSAERRPGPPPSGGHASRSCRVTGQQVMQYGLASVAPSGNSAIFAAPTGTASAWEISRRVGCGRQWSRRPALHSVWRSRPPGNCERAGRGRARRQRRPEWRSGADGLPRVCYEWRPGAPGAHGAVAR